MRQGVCLNLGKETPKQLLNIPMKANLSQSQNSITSKLSQKKIINHYHQESVTNSKSSS